jgi:hypothetical protein
MQGALSGWLFVPPHYQHPIVFQRQIAILITKNIRIAFFVVVRMRHEPELKTFLH